MARIELLTVELGFEQEGCEVVAWVLEMFFDAFPSAIPFSHAYNDGQPVISAPIISVDRIGNLTVAFSTGQQ